MKKTLTTALLTIGLSITPALLPSSAQAEVPRSDRWQLSYLDAKGNPTDLRNAYEMVAFIRGPRNFVLELACNARDNMVFRLARRAAGQEQFTGAAFKPAFEVLDNGRGVYEFAARSDFDYRDGPMHYQGPVRRRLMNELAKGDAVRVSEQGNPLRVNFSLAGSAAVIDALPCGIEE